MNKSPKVSVIIPVYNGENYVQEAIESALSQTYKNIEIIVVNDGSKDRTEMICKEYKGKIKYFKKNNGGVSTALNLAIEKMTGEYFSWLSHDDLYYPNKIEEEIKAMEENTIILSDYDLVNEKGKVFNSVVLPHYLIKRNNQFALLNGLINGITLLIPKKAFDECGKFDENLKCTQDYEMWFRMMLKGYKFKHIPKILASSRQHSNQTTNTSPKMLSEGNELWINMMTQLPNKMKKELYQTEYNFYKEMYNFLKNTPYEDAEMYALEKQNELYKKLDLTDIKVSVIMPFYDESQKILKRAVNSVKNQTHKNIEFIVINDNKDFYKNGDIDFIKNDKNIIYLENNKNLGVSASRNSGIKTASGEYIAFLDADDEFLKDKIETQLNELVLCGGSFSHTSYKRINETENVINSGLQSGNILDECIYHCEIATPTVMIKSKILNEVLFDENLKIGEDTCLWIELLIKYSIIGINIPLTNVYVDKNSAAYNNEKQIEGLKNILKYVLNNENLKNFDKSIALAAQNYSNMVLKTATYNEYLEIINSKSWKITAPLRLASKSIKTIKDSGLKSFFIKTKKYLKEKGKK